MKKLIALLVLYGFVLQIMAKLFVVMNYQANKDYIAAELCENKNKPELKCEGKCHLTKELQKEEKREGENSPNNAEKSKLEVEWMSLHPTTNYSFNYKFISLSTPMFIPFLRNQFQPQDIFHPPAVA